MPCRASRLVRTTPSSLRFGGLAIGPLAWCWLAIGCEAAPTAVAPHNLDQPMVAAAAAETPPMGWNSWNSFGCDISQEKVLAMAEAMVGSGLQDAGYEYVVVDDCWQAAERNADGSVALDPDFPDMAQLVSDVHALGLKFGIYTDLGEKTCQERAGSLGHHAIDAATYVAWGVDYVKLDWCFSEGLDPAREYASFRGAIESAREDFGRKQPVMLSACTGGKQEPWVWAPTSMDLWRTTEDIVAPGATPEWGRVLGLARETTRYVATGSPGHFNDPDMLVVGRGLSDDEDRAHFGLWAMLGAPLIAGNDLINMDASTRSILVNDDIIAIDQDPGMTQGTRYSIDDAGGEVWVKLLAAPGERAVLLLNGSDDEHIVAAPRIVDLGLDPGADTSARDLFAGRDIESYEVEGVPYGALLAPHAAMVLRVVGEEATWPGGEVLVADLPLAFAANGLGNGPVERNLSVGQAEAGDGSSLAVRLPSVPVRLPDRSQVRTFESGFGVHAPSILVVRTLGRCSTFEATVGIDATVEEDVAMEFQVFADGRLVGRSARLSAGRPSTEMSIDLREPELGTGPFEVQLRVVPRGRHGTSWHWDGPSPDQRPDRAVWGAPMLHCVDP